MSGDQREPLVSVVLPVFNDEETIEECISSLARQDYSDIELIVVDDGSTDRSPSVLSELSKKYPLTIVRTDHGGRSRAKNSGITRAQGPMVALAEADAKYGERWVSAAVRFLTDDVAAVVGPRYCWFTDSIVAKSVDLKLRVRYHNPDFHPMTGWIFTKRALEDVQGFDPSLNVAEDRDIGIRVKKAGYRVVFAADSVMFHAEPRSLREFLEKEFSRSVARCDFYRKYPREFPLARVATLWFLIGLGALGTLFFLPIFAPSLVLTIILLVATQALRVRAKAKSARVEYERKILLSSSVLDIIRNASSLFGATIAGFKILL